jgi:hypothetical protein
MVPTYQLRVYGVGLLVNAKSISSHKSKFWVDKKTTELTRYVFDGDEDFDEFNVPAEAKFKGLLAEEEQDLDIFWSHDSPLSQYKIQQIYGPKLDSIERIECVDTSNEERLLWFEEKPILEKYLSPEDPDEEVTAYLDICADNLLIFESEKGCWVYECKSEIQKPPKNSTELRVVLTNCSFGIEIDSIIDDVCVGFMTFDRFFELSEADADTLGTYATIHTESN